MLDFKHGSSFAIKVITHANTDSTLQEHGFTKAGPFTFSFVTGSSSPATTNTFQLPDMPIVLSVIDSEGSFAEGECWASVVLQLNGSLS